MWILRRVSPWVIFLSVCSYLGLICLISRITSLYLGLHFYSSSTLIFVEFEILNFYSFSLDFIMLFDWMSLCFISVVLIISSIVLFYRNRYIKGDPNLYKFIILVFLFIVSIVFLIISPNIIRILLGWDGLGLVSYCLVIYYQNRKSCSAGLLTVLSNRIGDVAILLRISWLLNYGSCSFFFLQHSFIDSNLLIIFFFVILASITKRAQIPFSAWLPAAIAAPTPVSSLVHSSTLVTAGVYLLIRFHNVLEYNYLLFIISIITIFMSGLGANFETDLKKIIALSTLSQLGVMIIVLSFGLYELAFLHLLRHALFKSLLFLCAGFFIHSYSDFQDIRSISSCSFFSPVISLYFFCSSISLCGFPFISGFYSKDIIIESLLITNFNLLTLSLLFISTILTLTYSVRLIYYLTFFSIGCKTISSLIDDHSMFYPITILFSFSIIGGSFFSWCFFPCFFIYLSLFTKISVIFLLYIFLVLCSFFLNKNFLMYSLVNKWLYFIRNMWNMPFISTFLMIKNLFIGGPFLNFVDRGWLEHYGGQGLLIKLSYNSHILNSITNTNIKAFLFFFFFILFSIMYLLYLNSLT